MDQHEHLGVVAAAQGDTEKIAYANIDGHLHAVQRTTQYDAFAMKFDLPHATVGAGIICVEANRQGKRVEPQCAARPGGIDPACWWLTPHGSWSPRRDYVPGRCVRP